VSTHDTLESILAPIRDYTPKSSPGSIESFMESTLYEDFLQELKVRIENLRDFYEECPKDKYLETRGALAMLRVVGGIFTDLLNNSEEALKEPEDK